MSTNNTDYSGTLRTLKIIHIALIVFPVIFGAFAFWMNTNQTAQGHNAPEVLIYAPVVLLVLAFPLSTILFKKAVSEVVGSQKPLKNKLQAFQGGHLIRMALFEVAGLMAAVVAFVTGNNYILLVLLVVMGMFFLLVPTASKVALDLELNADEKSALTPRLE
ncbi:MAG: hypothetical protein R3345_06115 [Fulvivirga sp.]|nr:hypothetical protein [Fulvivirga sp.]